MKSTFRRVLLWSCCAAGLLLGGEAAHAQPNTGKIVGAIDIEGASIYTTDQIISQLQTRVDKPFSQVTAMEDYNRLFGKGWFRRLDIKTDPMPDGKVRVIIEVDELRNRIQSIDIRGVQHIGKDELNKLIGLKVGMPMSPVANRAAVQAIVRKYQEQGRLNASARLVEGDKENDTRVVIDVVEGLPVKIGDISFRFLGNSSGDITSGRLRQQINSSRSYGDGFTGGRYDPVQVDFDVIRLLDYYKALGYLDARVSVDRTLRDNNRMIDLLFVVAEGPRYKVGDVKIEGNRVYESNSLLRLTDLRPDATYDKFVVNADVRRIKDYYGYAGRQVPVEERFYIDPEKPGIVHVAYQITERPEARVGEVIVEGNDRTRERVIRRQVPIYPGQILSYPDLLQAEQNLSRLGIFEEDPAQGTRPTVTVDDPEVDNPFKTVRVRVKEKPTGSFLLGVGVNSDSGINGSIVVNERNFDWLSPPSSLEDILAGRAFRGAGQELRIEAVPGTQLQRYSVSFREPYLFDGPYSLGTSGYFYQRSFFEYNETRLGGRITLGRKLSQYWAVNGAVRVEDVDVSAIKTYAPAEIAKDAGHSFLVGTRAGLTRDSRDNYLRPSSGSVLDVGYEQVFGDYNFPIITAEGTQYWTTYSRVDGSGKHVLAFRSQAAYAGDDAPVFERFYGGGFRSIRGYAFRGVGPHVGDFNVGGRFSFLNSLEYQVPILANDNLFGVAFIDTGTIERNVNLRDYRVAAGGGLRIAVPQLLGPVPIALDFAVPLHNIPGDKKQLFSFYLGFFN